MNDLTPRLARGPASDSAFSIPVGPTARTVLVPAPGPVRALPETRQDIADLPVGCTDGVRPMNQVLVRGHVNAMVVLADGKLVAEYEAGPGGLARPHLLMSVTKSLIGCLAGILTGQGVLDPDRPVTDLVPELAAGYADTSIAQVLDMRTGVDYTEDDDATARAHVLGEVMGYPGSPWSPALRDSLYGNLTRLSRRTVPGGPFVYRSVDTDVLGWVLERVTGESMPTMLSQLLLGPIGAQTNGTMVTDRYGCSAHAGGLSLTAHDVARFALMLQQGGAVGARQVVPVRFLQETLAGRPDSLQAFRSRTDQVLGPDAPRAEQTIYCNQFWVPQVGGRRLLCLGIHGQLVLVDAVARVVCVLLSWWPTARNPVLFADALAAAEALVDHFGIGLTRRPGVVHGVR